MSVTNPAGNLAGTASENTMTYAVWPWITTVPKFGSTETLTYQLSTAASTPTCTPSFYSAQTKTIGSVGCVTATTNVPFDSVISPEDSKFDANSLTLAIGVV